MCLKQEHRDHVEGNGWLHQGRGESPVETEAADWKSLTAALAFGVGVLLLAFLAWALWRLRPAAEAVISLYIRLRYGTLGDPQAVARLRKLVAGFTQKSVFKATNFEPVSSVEPSFLCFKLPTYE